MTIVYSPDLAAAYQEYLTRYEALVGTRDVGQYGKWGRHLVRKYSFEEFGQRYEQFLRLERTCHHIIETGATMNDAASEALQDAAAEILLDVDPLKWSAEHREN